MSTESDDSDWLPPETARVRAILRFASWAFPILTTTILLLICWRQHFSKQSNLATLFAMAAIAHLSIAICRRSRGLSARIFTAYTGPDRDWSHQDRSDIGLLWGIAVFSGGMVYILVKQW